VRTLKLCVTGFGLDTLGWTELKAGWLDGECSRLGSIPWVKDTTHYLWISEQYEKTGIRADWTFSCSCHGKCDCDPEGGACKNVVKLHQLRDSAQNRTILNNIDELAESKAAVPCTSGTFTTSKLPRSK
jgi:hypothetical protein